MFEKKGSDMMRFGWMLFVSFAVACWMFFCFFLFPEDEDAALLKESRRGSEASKPWSLLFLGEFMPLASLKAPLTW